MTVTFWPPHNTTTAAKMASDAVVVVELLDGQPPAQPLHLLPCHIDQVGSCVCVCVERRARKRENQALTGVPVGAKSGRAPVSQYFCPLIETEVATPAPRGATGVPLPLPA